MLLLGTIPPRTNPFFPHNSQTPNPLLPAAAAPLKVPAHYTDRRSLVMSVTRKPRMYLAPPQKSLSSLSSFSSHRNVLLWLLIVNAVLLHFMYTLGIFGVRSSLIGGGFSYLWWWQAPTLEQMEASKEQTRKTWWEQVRAENLRRRERRKNQMIQQGIYAEDGDSKPVRSDLSF